MRWRGLGQGPAGRYMRPGPKVKALAALGWEVLGSSNEPGISWVEGTCSGSTLQCKAVAPRPEDRALNNFIRQQV